MTIIASVCFLVFRHPLSSDRSVGARLFISWSKDCFTWLKSDITLFDFCLVMELDLSEQIAAISLCRSWPTVRTIAAFVTVFFRTQFTANAR